jgi:hypothetical protein
LQAELYKLNLEYSAAQALAVSSQNPARAWMGDGTLAAQSRFNDGEMFAVQHRPKFLLKRDVPIYTVGSCFAREVENVLTTIGVPLALDGHGVPAEAFQSWDETAGTGGGVKRGQLSRGALNKYDVHAMSHDIRRALLEEAYPQEGLIEIAPGRWFDPHSSGLRPAPFDEAMTNRRRIAAAVARIRAAEVTFMTLGLTESWFDQETGLAMNVHPGAAALKKFGERFRFVDHGFSEIAEEMHGLIKLIRERANPNMHFLVTVSPVPLGSTFRRTDVVVSNAGSKAVLRAVADDLQRTYDYVDYFPSYEMVVNTPRHLAWTDDQLHVTTSMVRHVMQVFKQAYFPDRAEAVAAA